MIMMIMVDEFNRHYTQYFTLNKDLHVNGLYFIYASHSKVELLSNGILCDPVTFCSSLYAFLLMVSKIKKMWVQVGESGSQACGSSE